MAKFVILLFGNICAGKTEFVRYLEQQKESFLPFLGADENVNVFPEFIDPMALENFYHDRKRYTNEFELSCLIGRITRYNKAKREKGIYVFDRGMIEGAETFSKNSFQEGYLGHTNYEHYLHLLKDSLDSLDRTEQKSWLEQLLVYFHVEDARVLYQRQLKRKTPGEIIPLDYLQRINDRYTETFQNIKEVYARYGVRAPETVPLDASTDFHADRDYHPRILRGIVKELSLAKQHGKL